MRNTSIPSVSISQVESNLPGEDRYSVRVTNHVSAFAVYDGHGGYLACDMACGTLLDIIIADLLHASSEELTNIRIAEIIEAAFVKCDEDILSEALRLHRQQADRVINSPNNQVQNQPQKLMGRAGTCAVVVVITRGMLFTAHVGDCRAVLISDEPIDTGHEMATTSAGVNPCVDDDNENLNNNNSNNSSNINSNTRKRQPLSTSQRDSCGSSVSSLCRVASIRPPTTSGFTILDTFLLDVEKKTAPSSSSSSSSLSQSSQHSSQSMKTYSKRPTRAKAPPSKQPSDFTSTIGGITAKGITLDHGCDVMDEIEGIRYLSTDPNPARPSEGDRKALGARAPLRVAGSLAVSRALGDSYLKIAELSTPQYVAHLPYITGRPTISYRALQSTDRAIILASDGLWNFIQARDCSEIMGQYLDARRTTTRLNEGERDKVNFCTVMVPEYRNCPTSSSNADLRVKRQRFGTDGGLGENTSEDSTKGSRVQPPHHESRFSWEPQHVADHNFLFTLDSHIATMELNTCSGFVPLATATASVALSFVPPPTGSAAANSVDGASSSNASSSSASSSSHEARATVNSLVTTTHNTSTSNNRVVSTIRVTTTVTTPGDDDGRDGPCDSNSTTDLGHAVVRQEDLFHIQTKASLGGRGSPSANGQGRAGDCDTVAGKFCFDYAYPQAGGGRVDALGGGGRLCSAADDTPHSTNSVKQETEGSDILQQTDEEPVDAGRTTTAIETRAERGGAKDGVQGMDGYHLEVILNEGPAGSLMEKCLDYAAANSRNRNIYTGAQLKRLPQGVARRGLVDDITVLVLTFE